MESDPTQKPFTPEVLDKTVIAIPLLEILRKEGEGQPRALHPIIIDINLEYHEGRPAARERITQEIAEAIQRFGSPDRPAVQQGVNAAKTRLSEQYIFRGARRRRHSRPRQDRQRGTQSIGRAGRSCRAARHLPDLARLQDPGAHQQDRRDGQGGRGALVVFRRRRRHRLGRARFGRRQDASSLCGHQNLVLSPALQHRFHGANGPGDAPATSSGTALM